MKLLLTSTWISGEKLVTFFQENLAEFRWKTVALIYTIRRPSDERWIALRHEELESLGMKYRDINISEDRDYSQIEKCDAYYVCGGNTFYILERLKKTGLFGVLVDEIKAGKLYIGVSAGSIITWSNIEIAGCGEAGDENDIGLQDLSGMNLASTVIYPHYMDEFKSDIEEFEKKRKVKVLTLRDGEGIFVDANKQVPINI